MIKLNWIEPTSIQEVRARVQTAIDLEFSTLPPYLYAQFSIPPGANLPASERLHEIILEEMIHMCLVCNIMNALGGTPAINPPHYPGPLPGDIGDGVVIHLLALSPAAMRQGMAIEEPSEPIHPRALRELATAPGVTIGEYYSRLDLALMALPASAWSANRKQIDDAQFFVGQIFAINSYDDASRAISQIVSEGEGTPVTADGSGSPLDFENEVAHYYRFWEIEQNRLLVRDAGPVGYAWKGPLGVDWSAVYPAISDPQTHDFSQDSQAAQKAQADCNAAFTAMVDALTDTFNGVDGGLGVAVRAMFNLRMAAAAALGTPLADGKSVAGPAFLYLRTPETATAGGAA